jgi:16S rRNA (cytosine1402-N4)-methyltransferase
MLEAFPLVTLIGLDRDPQALALAALRLARFADRVRFCHVVYDEIRDELLRLGIPAADVILMDLGVSSMQLDQAERGFAYAQDAPLDMRMDPTEAVPTAAHVVNTYGVAELARVLSAYGEERFARRIAERIVAERARSPLTSSARLADLVREAIPAAARRTGGNPAKRTFQALRIEVNRELAVLEAAMPAAIASLAVGGRIIVLTYHSLEDRIVKRALAHEAAVRVPDGLPVVPDSAAPRLRVLERGSQATEAEIAVNPRAASARIRAAERVRAA